MSLDSVPGPPANRATPSTENRHIFMIFLRYFTCHQKTTHEDDNHFHLPNSFIPQNGPASAPHSSLVQSIGYRHSETTFHRCQPRDQSNTHQPHRSLLFSNWYFCLTSTYQWLQLQTYIKEQNTITADNPYLYCITSIEKGLTRALRIEYFAINVDCALSPTGHWAVVRPENQTSGTDFFSLPRFWKPGIQT